MKKIKILRASSLSIYVICAPFLAHQKFDPGTEVGVEPNSSVFKNWNIYYFNE